MVMQCTLSLFGVSTTMVFQLQHLFWVRKTHSCCPFVSPNSETTLQTFIQGNGRISIFIFVTIPFIFLSFAKLVTRGVITKIFLLLWENGLVFLSTASVHEPVSHVSYQVILWILSQPPFPLYRNKNLQY